MPSIDPLLLSLLLILIGLLAVLSSLLSNKLSQKHASSTTVYFVFILAVVCAALLTLVGWLITVPQVSKGIYYGVLGIGYGCSLLATVVLLKTRPDEISSSTTDTTLRQQVQTRYKLLEDVRREVEGRLESSLHHKVLINLVKKNQNQQIECRWAVEVKIGNEPSTHMAANAQIVEVFDSNAIAGKLLILGAPGAGKTTTLLEITRELSDRAFKNPDEPIPVLFNLSTWKNDKQALADWLVAELMDKWGVRVDIGRHWLENRQILPLLDGLDELELNRQEQCVKAINQLLAQPYSPKHLVVCSRQDEYELCNTQLYLNGAVCLQLLTYAQVHDYLMDVGCPELWQSIKNEPELLKLVRTPLLLSIMTLAYEGTSFEEWQKCNSAVARRQYLFDAYIERMLKREIKHQWYAKGKAPSSLQTRNWLIWLSNRLKEESQAEFLIERMQLTWLQTPAQKQIYRIGVGLIGGLIIGLVGGLLVELNSDEQEAGLIIGLLSGLLSGLTLGFWQKIQPVETVKWNWSGKVRSGLIFGLIFGAIFGLICGLTFSLIHISTIGLTKVLFFSLCAVLVFCLFGGLFGALIGGLSGPDIEKRTFPNQGIWRSAANTVVFAVVGGLIFSPLGVLIGAIVPGTACIQHFMLRLILWWNGYIPWNYARFLNYATERVFLNRVGGRYRFIHDLLREHFAQLQ